MTLAVVRQPNRNGSHKRPPGDDPPVDLSEPGWGRPYEGRRASCRWCHQIVWFGGMPHPRLYLVMLKCSPLRRLRCVSAALHAVQHGTAM